MLIVGGIALAATGVAVFLHYYPSRGDLTVMLTSAVPFALVVALAAVLIFGALRRWILLAVAVVASVVLGQTQAPLWIAETAPAGPRFTVVSANLLFGRADLTALSTLIADADADLVSLQEVTPEALAAIRASPIGHTLPHIFAIPFALAGGTALLSRRPLTDTFNIPGTVLHNLSARTDLPGAPGTRVLAIHPAAPLNGATRTWMADMDRIADHLRSLPPGRAIAAGDFNSTRDHARFRDLLDLGFADTTDQAGAGFLPTYPTDRSGNRPLVAIDHVIVRGFVATSVRTFHLPSSDHRAVVVSLVAS
ncbi:endonuclease/exonuclease/phosphatase family protein [Gordonia sp. ABSL1-1]|uniref:endonuclease/exonuclease/phosphatase family protein n=1 Tax=Gordonia sp. ABSL1-1 TaxID=3053923 RepID=UPI0025731C2A|nr:endonuclease/exonuclease/phosphatase family protein [Gordonia sp. ABSL1-1]MDL9937336.1 endonuclease/exonuclease/phosphatase family protein [Gordonia sp. ABSL1-1]